MGESFLEKTGGAGVKLNDIIEDFKYVYKGQTIKAGDFVNYVNGVSGITNYGTSTDTQISTTTNSASMLSAVLLDENRVFIAHSYTSNYHLYGIVLSINGTTITYGTDTQLSTTAYSGGVVSATLVSNGNVFIAHQSNNTTSQNYLHGIVVSVSGTTITAGTDTQIVSTATSGSIISAVSLPDNKVFIAHTYGGTSYYLYGIVCNVSGTTITKGTDTSIVTSRYAGFYISTCVLDESRVFIGHCFSSSQYLYAIVCKIAGTTISKGSSKCLANAVTYEGSMISTLKINSNKVFVAHSHNTSPYLNAMVCTISDTTISIGTDTSLSTTSGSGSEISVELLPSGKIFIVHSMSGYYLYGMICNVDNTTITYGTDTQLSTIEHGGRWLTSVLLNNGKVLIPHSYTKTWYLYTQIWGIDEENNIPTNNIVITEYEQQVMPAIRPPFNAIALSSGVGGTNTEHNEQVKIARVYNGIKTDNLFAKTWTKVSNTEYIADGGIKLTSSYALDNYTPNLACDGDDSSYHAFGTGDTESWVQLEFPNLVTISKMKVKLTYSLDCTNFKAYIIASNTGDEWITLSEIVGSTSASTATLDNYILENVSSYKFYRIQVTKDDTKNGSWLYEWQTSEYVEVI